MARRRYKNLDKRTLVRLLRNAELEKDMAMLVLDNIIVDMVDETGEVTQVSYAELCDKHGYHKPDTLIKKESELRKK